MSVGLDPHLRRKPKSWTPDSFSHRCALQKYGLREENNYSITATYSSVPNPRSQELWRISAKREQNWPFGQPAQSTALVRKPAVLRHSGRQYWQQRILDRVGLAEREGFEPPMPLRACRISSAVHSTTLPPLQGPRTSITGPTISPLGGVAAGQAFMAARLSIAKRRASSTWEVISLHIREGRVQSPAHRSAYGAERRSGLACDGKNGAGGRTRTGMSCDGGF